MVDFNAGAFFQGLGSQINSQKPTGRSVKTFEQFKAEKAFTHSLDMKKLDKEQGFKREDQAFELDREEKNRKREIEKTHALNVLRVTEINRDKWIKDTGSSDNFPITYASFKTLYNNPYTSASARKLFAYKLAGKNNKKAMNGIAPALNSFSFIRRTSSDNAGSILSRANNDMTFEKSVAEVVSLAETFNSDPVGYMAQIRENIGKFKKHGIGFKEDGSLAIGQRAQNIANNYNEIKNNSDGSDIGIRKGYLNQVQNEIKRHNKGQFKPQKKTPSSFPVSITKGFIEQGYTPLQSIKTVKGTSSLSKTVPIQKLIVNNAMRIAKENNKDLGRPQLAAILAAAYRESSLDPTKAGDGGKSIGLFQIQKGIHVKNGSITQQEEDNLQDAAINLRLILTKVNKGALNNEKFMNAKTVKEASDIFTQEIEIPRDMKNEKTMRSKMATQFFKNFSIQPKSEPVPKEDTTSDFDKKTNKRYKGLSKLRLLKTVGDDLKNPKVEISVEAMIGTRKEPNNEMVNAILEAEVPQYSQIQKGEGNFKFMSSWTKARTILEKHNGKINTFQKLGHVAREKHNKETILQKKNLELLTINGENVVTVGGNKIILPTLPNEQGIQKKLEKEVAQTYTPGTTGTQKQLIAGHTAMLRLLEIENTLAGLKQQHGESVGSNLVTKILEDSQNKFKFLKIIRQSAGAVPFKAFQTWNLNDTTFPTLSKHGGKDFKDALIKAHATRETTYEKELKKGGIAATVKTHRNPVNQINADLWVPVGHISDSSEVQKKDVIEHTPFKLPSSDNTQRNDIVTFGPENSSLAGLLSGRSKIIQSKINEQYGYVDPQLFWNRLRQHLNENLFEKMRDADSNTKVQLAQNWFTNLSKNPEFSPYMSLFGTEMIKAVSFIAYEKHINNNRITNKTANLGASGVTGSVTTTSDEVKLIPQEKYAKSAAVKAFNQIKPFLYNVKQGLQKSLATYKDTAEMTIEEVTQAGGFSPEVVDVFEETMNELDKDKRTLGDLRDAAEIMVANPIREIREKGQLIISSLEMTGAKRASTIGAGFDRIIIGLDTLGSLFKTEGKRITATFLKAFNNVVNKQFDSSEEQWNVTPTDNRHRIKNKNERFEHLQKRRKAAQEKLDAVINDTRSSSTQKKLALLTARRTFDAITLTYQFAGMVQGGSGGRAISNEDFENMWRALWGGDGEIQPHNLRHALGVVSDVEERNKILTQAARRGEATAAAVADTMLPVQQGLRLFKDRQYSKRIDRVLGISNESRNIALGKNQRNTEYQKRFQTHIRSFSKLAQIVTEPLIASGKIDINSTPAKLSESLSNISISPQDLTSVTEKLNAVKTNAMLNNFGMTFNNQEELPMRNMHDFLYAQFVYLMQNSDLPLPERMVDAVVDIEVRGLPEDQREKRKDQIKRLGNYTWGSIMNYAGRGRTSKIIRHLFVTHLSSNLKNSDSRGQ